MADPVNPVPNIQNANTSAEQYYETQIKLNEELGRTSKAFVQLRTSNVELFQQFAKLNEGVRPLAQDLASVKQAITELVSADGGLKLLNVVANEILTTSQELAKSIDKARADYVKTTGEVVTYFGAARSEARDASAQISIFGVNTYEARASMIQTLPIIANFKDEFSFANKEVQASIASMGQLGISTKTSAENINIFIDAIKPMGTQIRDASFDRMNTDLTTANNRLLETTSKINELGYSVVDAANMINKSGDIITVFGENALVDLAAQAKLTKLSIDELTSVAAKFETFDSAAQHVGKLNALLGADYLSVTEMMFAEPAEQVQNISKAFQDAGFSLDSLGEQEKKYALLTVQSTLGLKDKTTAMRFLQADSFEQARIIREQQDNEQRRIDTQEKLNKLMMESIPVLEQLSTTLKAFFGVIEPAFTALNYTLSFVVEYLNKITTAVGGAMGDLGGFGEFLKFIFGAAMISGILYLTWGFGQAAKGAVDMATKLPKLVDGLSTVSDSINATARNTGVMAQNMGNTAAPMQQMSNNIQQTGTSASAAAKSMLLYGAAILMIGVGIGAAAFGISYLVEAFQGLGDAAVPAAVAVLLFTGAMGVMIYFLAGSAVVTATAGTAMLPFAGVILAIGVAIAIAAAGMGYFVQSFKDLGPAALMFATSLGMIVAPLARLVLMIPSFGLLAAAFAGLSLSLLALTASAFLFNSVGGLKFDLTGIDQLKDFKKDINELNGKTIKVKVDLELPKLDSLKVTASAVSPSAVPIERNVTVNIKEIIVKIGNEKFDGYIDGRIEAKMNEAGFKP